MIAPLIRELNAECADAFDNFRLKSMKYSISKNECELFLHYRMKQGQDYRAFERAAKLILPEGIRYRFHYARVSDHESAVRLAARSALHEYFKITVSDEDVKAFDGRVVVGLPYDQYCRCEDESAKAVLIEALDTEFCRSIDVTFEQKGDFLNATDIAAELRQGIKEEIVPAAAEGKRVIEPFNIEKYIGDTIEPPAMYIRDVKADPDEKIVLCGKLSNIRLDVRNSAKNPGKTFTIFRAMLTDFTGEIPCFTFVSESNLSKYQELDASTAVLACGVADKAYNSDLPEFRISRLSYCELPADFEEQVYKKDAPAKYSKIFPKPFAAARQQNLFETNQEQVHPKLDGETFVVFDTETTGVNLYADRIIEIACVKIRDGKLIEHLETFVNPGIHIPEGASRVNHITDDMVANAPLWSEVAGDVYKFCKGHTLVGHNVRFDIGMLNNTARDTHYYFENDTIDTLALAREKVHGVHDYTLRTLLRTFGLTNENAHRALTDTVATARLFMKLFVL